MTIMSAAELQRSLSQFIGTSQYHRHWSGVLVFTDGVHFLAENAGAYWFLDLIASWQKRAMKDRMLREFQIWELRVKRPVAIAVCLRDSDDEAFRQEIPFTDFPLDFMKLYLETGVLMLPSER